MIAVIADDLTGAAELAGVGWRHKLRSEVLLSGKPGSRCDLVCVDTDSRACVADQAARLAGSAAKALGSVHPQWIYKKVDSVLRGQVVPEIESILQQVGLKRALLLPANPSLGRVIQGGRYFIKGQPIDQTEFARDPNYPRTSSRVLDLLKKPKQLPLELCPLDGELPAEGIVVGEAGSFEDLRRWASKCGTDTLAAGGAEFFNALLMEKRSRKSPAPRVRGFRPAATASGRAVFVCGSVSESSRRFIAEEEQKCTPVFSHQDGKEPAELTSKIIHGIAERALQALETHSRVILQIGLPLIAEARQAAEVTDWLTELASTVLERADVDQVFAEGGATARALAIKMGWGRLSVSEEVALGIVTLRPENRPRLRFTIKPGSYVWPERIRGLDAEGETTNEHE